MAKRTKEQIDKRADQIRRDDDKLPNLSIGLYDLDYTIQYYIENKIKPKVMENGEWIDVPVMYASPERWASIKRDGYLRTAKGQLMIPLITFRKTEISPMQNMYRISDPNAPNMFIERKNRYSKYNRYDPYDSSVVTNSVEYHNIVVPTYINNSYEIILWTNTTPEMNRIIEAFLYARDSYWGETNKFKFFVRVGNFSPTIEYNDGTDRFLQTSFSVSMNGHIIPETIQKELSDFKARNFSKTIAIDTEISDAREGVLPNTTYSDAIDSGSTIIKISDKNGVNIKTIIISDNYNIDIKNEIDSAIDNNNVIVIK